MALARFAEEFARFGCEVHLRDVSLQFNKTNNNSERGTYSSVESEKTTADFAAEVAGSSN